MTALRPRLPQSLRERTRPLLLYAPAYPWGPPARLPLGPAAPAKQEIKERMEAEARARHRTLSRVRLPPARTALS
jgi:hypothetical protein